MDKDQLKFDIFEIVKEEEKLSISEVVDKIRAKYGGENLAPDIIISAILCDIHVYELWTDSSLEPTIRLSVWEQILNVHLKVKPNLLTFIDKMKGDPRLPYLTGTYLNKRKHENS